MRNIRILVFIGITVVFMISGFITSAVADQWTLMTPTTAPPAYSDGAMAYVGADQVVLFEGPLYESFVPVNATWLYDLSEHNWTSMWPLSSPAIRRYHAMAYLGNDRAILFGGSEQYNEWPSDTWVYDVSDNNWTVMEPATSPASRRSHAMAYVGDDKALLFGGITSDYNDSGETWVYDFSDESWTLMNPAQAPSARRNHAMAYLGGDKVLLFAGGFADGPMSNETWIYDLSDNNWTSMSPAQSPVSRRSHGMASLGGDQVLLFGGYSSEGIDGETWIYDLSDNAWTEKNLSTAPTPRQLLTMAPISDGRVLLHGGYSTGPTSGETWLYEPVSGLEAQIDIMFCGNPNSFNRKKKGVLPVTIFGSSTLDVNAIAISSVKLCLASSPDSCVSAIDAEFPADRGNPSTDLGTSQCVGNIATPDGLDDLDVHFIAQEVATLINCASLGKKEPSPTLIVKGELGNGTPFTSTAVNNTGIDQLLNTGK